MKKLLLFGMAGAMALTFSACSSDSDVVEQNPTFDGESVKTSFTISVGDVTDGTRMSENSVQKDATFKGMTDIYLFPAKEVITATTVTSESYIHLPDFTSFSTEVNDAQGKIYKDVAFSIGVNNILFYAATPSSNKDNGELRASYLAMTSPVEWAPEPMLTTSTVKDIHFDLVPIQKDKGLNDVKLAGVATIAPLNAVMAALAAQSAAAETAGATTAKAELDKIYTTLQNKKSDAYKAYAGSSPSQKALMTNIYTAVKNMEAVLTVSGENYGEPVTTAIETYFNVTEESDDSFTLAWNTDPNFPANLNLPDGSVGVIFNETSAEFEYTQPSVDGMEVPSIGNYTYPARLYYTINTPTMVKNAEYLSTLNNDYATWKEVKEAGEYIEKAIESPTRSVIMKDQVQYAVGRMDVAVRVKPATTILDRGSADPESGMGIPQPVTVPGNGYKLTGVLIGNQKNVAWDFTPISSVTEQTIWDANVIEGIFAKQQADYSSYNPTLALETAVNTPVKIALEFENTGNDFYGVDNNIIPAGTKFYLVANLDPTTNTTYKVQDPETPWAAGAELIKQVFLQDYVTTVNLTIGETSLQNAYNVIPDLRSPKLEFGLSVDLHWRAGITFEQEF